MSPSLSQRIISSAIIISMNLSSLTVFAQSKPPKPEATKITPKIERRIIGYLLDKPKVSRYLEAKGSPPLPFFFESPLISNKMTELSKLSEDSLLSRLVDISEKPSDAVAELFKHPETPDLGEIAPILDHIPFASEAVETAQSAMSWYLAPKEATYQRRLETIISRFTEKKGVKAVLNDPNFLNLPENIRSKITTKVLIQVAKSLTQLEGVSTNKNSDTKTPPLLSLAAEDKTFSEDELQEVLSTYFRDVSTEELSKIKELFNSIKITDPTKSDTFAPTLNEEYIDSINQSQQILGGALMLTQFFGKPETRAKAARAFQIANAVLELIKQILINTTAGVAAGAGAGATAGSALGAYGAAIGAVIGFMVAIFGNATSNDDQILQALYAVSLQIESLTIWLESEVKNIHIKLDAILELQKLTLENIIVIRALADDTNKKVNELVTTEKQNAILAAFSKIADGFNREQALLVSRLDTLEKKNCSISDSDREDLINDLTNLLTAISPTTIIDSLDPIVGPMLTTYSSGVDDLFPLMGIIGAFQTPEDPSRLYTRATLNMRQYLAILKNLTRVLSICGNKSGDEKLPNNLVALIDPILEPYYLYQETISGKNKLVENALNIAIQEHAELKSNFLNSLKIIEKDYRDGIKKLNLENLEKHLEGISDPLTSDPFKSDPVNQTLDSILNKRLRLSSEEGELSESIINFFEDLKNGRREILRPLSNALIKNTHNETLDAPRLADLQDHPKVSVANNLFPGIRSNEFAATISDSHFTALSGLERLALKQIPGALFYEINGRTTYASRPPNADELRLKRIVKNFPLPEVIFTSLQCAATFSLNLGGEFRGPNTPNGVSGKKLSARDFVAGTFNYVDFMNYLSRNPHSPAQSAALFYNGDGWTTGYNRDGTSTDLVTHSIPIIVDAREQIVAREKTLSIIARVQEKYLEILKTVAQVSHFEAIGNLKESRKLKEKLKSILYGITSNQTHWENFREALTNLEVSQIRLSTLIRVHLGINGAATPEVRYFIQGAASLYNKWNQMLMATRLQVSKTAAKQKWNNLFIHYGSNTIQILDEASNPPANQYDLLVNGYLGKNPEVGIPLTYPVTQATQLWSNIGYSEPFVVSDLGSENGFIGWLNKTKIDHPDLHAVSSSRLDAAVAPILEALKRK